MLFFGVLSVCQALSAYDVYFTSIISFHPTVNTVGRCWLRLGNLGSQSQYAVVVEVAVEMSV